MSERTDVTCTQEAREWISVDLLSDFKRENEELLAQLEGQRRSA